MNHDVRHYKFVKNSCLVLVLQYYIICIYGIVTTEHFSDDDDDCITEVNSRYKILYNTTYSTTVIAPILYHSFYLKDFTKHYS